MNSYAIGRKEITTMSMSYSSTYTTPRRTNTVNDSVARNRIAQLERQLRDSQNTAQRIRNDSNRRIDAIRAQMERENREFRRRETQMSREVNQIRRESNRALNEMAVRHANDLTQVQNRISEERHRAYVGKTLRVLADGVDGDMLTGRTDGGRLVRFPGDPALIGRFVPVAITGHTTWSLTGDYAPEQEVEHG